MSLSHCALATPVAGWAQCQLTRSPGVRCFRRYVGAAGFRVKCSLCQEAVRLGWVVFRKTRGSRPSALLCPYRSCSDETRLELPTGYHKIVENFFFFNIYILNVSVLDINITQQVGNCNFINEWFGRNQWLTANVAKQSLACYSVEWLCGPTFKIKGLLS
jgi:hypothetical protein